MMPIVNESSLAMLREAQEPGAPDIVEETVTAFLAEAALAITLLGGAVEAGDAPEVQRLAHAVRGACLFVGVSRLADACEVLETLGASGRMSEAPAALAHIVGEYTTARDALQRFAEGGAAA